MTLTFNLQGAERKPLVAAISEILETKAVYLKTPTYGFQIGEYNIDRNGTLTGADNFDLATALRNRGFTAESYDYDAANEEPEPEPATEREELGLGRERRENAQGENGMSADDVPEDETDRFTVEMPLDGFDPAKLDNLRKMVEAKATLLKAALGAEELPIQVTADTIKFPWFSAEGILTGGDEVEAYTNLIALLCETAKEKKRITAKEKPIEGSPKYALRCFLLSLGMIGGEYKTSRRILLSKMEGNGSWKNGKGERAVEETAPAPQAAVETPDDTATEAATTAE